MAGCGRDGATGSPLSGGHSGSFPSPSPSYAPPKSGSSGSGQSCCSNGVCSAPSAPPRAAAAPEPKGCCSNGVCSAPPARPKSPAPPVSKGCCSNGVCTAPKRDSRTAPAMDPELKKALASLNSDEVKDAGNAFYKKGRFTEALQLYDRAILLEPKKAPYRANRAAALAGLGRIAEAIRDCQEAVALDLSYTRAHQRLAGLLIRIGKLEEARTSIRVAPSGELKEEEGKLEKVARQVARAEEAYKASDWSALLRETDAAVSAGADCAPRVLKWKAEALLNLRKLEEADAALQAAQKFDPTAKPYRQDANINLLRAKIDLALGRFESASAAAESASREDQDSAEAVAVLKKARALGQARNRGNELYKGNDVKGAAGAYGEGLEADPTNAVLLCNRAACYSKLARWQEALKDAESALESHPRYTKALLRRAVCHSQLAMWEDAVRDYEQLLKEVPSHHEVAKGLAEAKAQLQRKRNGGSAAPTSSVPRNGTGEGGQVVEVTSAEQFRGLIDTAGLVVVDFFATWCGPCRQIAPLVTKLASQYRTARFLKVDIDKNQNLAAAEGIQSVPTFKIFKSGRKVREILGANAPELQAVVQQYCKA